MEKIVYRLSHVLTSRGMLDQKRAQHGQTHRMKSTFGRCGCQRWKLSPLPKTTWQADAWNVPTEIPNKLARGGFQPGRVVGRHL